MLPRTLEPEVMDSAAEAVDYDSMDHSDVNRRFVDDLLAACTLTAGVPTGKVRVLDVGTGTALIPLELLGRPIDAYVTGIDLAAHMLQLGQRHAIRAGVQSRLKLEQVDAKQLPYGDARFDWVISNSIIHHIPEPLEVVAEMWRVLKPGGLLFVRDLLRPTDLQTLQALVQTYAGTANPHQRQMFDDSLHAALTIAEVEQLLNSLQMPVDWIQQTSDRHWTIAGRK